ncbi:hypothetical protein IWW52_006210, partial [Coemansia sp. RSA 2704]
SDEGAVLPDQEGQGRGQRQRGGSAGGRGPARAAGRAAGVPRADRRVPGRGAAAVSRERGAGPAAGRAARRVPAARRVHGARVGAAGVDGAAVDVVDHAGRAARRVPRVAAVDVHSVHGERHGRGRLAAAAAHGRRAACRRRQPERVAAAVARARGAAAVNRGIARPAPHGGPAVDVCAPGHARGRLPRGHRACAAKAAAPGQPGRCGVGRAAAAAHPHVVGRRVHAAAVACRRRRQHVDRRHGPAGGQELDAGPRAHAQAAATAAAAHGCRQGGGQRVRGDRAPGRRQDRGCGVGRPADVAGVDAAGDAQGPAGGQGARQLARVEQRRQELAGGRRG